MALLLALLAGLVSVGAAPAGAVAAAEEEMSEQRAGQYYLRVVCPANEATQRFSRVVFGGRDRIPGQVVRRRLPELRRAAGAWAASIYREVRELLNPPKAWPSSVAEQVDTAAAKRLKVHDAVRDMSKADSALGYINHYKRALKFYRQGPSAGIRAQLDLPPPGRGC
ncbi:hypothetical protein ACNKF0_09545 [Nocardioides sp. T5]|uniref:hypothetical protein n=1 Tax=Nocardioides sp. T5 TaxID=3400182 RepID=UPI003A844ECD